MTTLHGSSGDLEIKSPADKFFKEFITTAFKRFALDKMDPAKKKVTFEMSDCLIADCYKIVKATITITPKEDGDGSCVVWTVAFEKIRHDINDPDLITDILNYCKEIDEKLNLN